MFLSLLSLFSLLPPMTTITELSRTSADSLWHPLMQHNNVKTAPPPVIVKGEGAILTDQFGNEWLDAIAGIWCVNVGYGREELAQVAYEQMKNLAYLSPMMVAEPTAKLADKLMQLVGMNGHVYFTPSGSEANEAAFKMAWQYHQQSGEPHGYLRRKIISRYRAYHGNTYGALGATGQAERKIGFGNQPAEIRHINPPYPYRRHPNLTPEEHGEQVAAELEQTIIYEGEQTVAAFIMEPMISGGGVLIPPDNYVPRIREICDKYGILLIFDEVVSGFGRTGKMFGHQHWSAMPDIMTCAKGIASGYQPIAATVVNEKIYNAFLSDGEDLNHYRNVSTYGGHPVATAVALKNIEIVEREGLVTRAAEMGAYMQEQFSQLLEHPNVGEVRGKGMLFGIELVNSKDTLEAIDPAKINKVIAGAKAEGVLIGKNGNTIPGLCNVLVLSPPLTITKDEADRIIAAVESGLKSII
ncbi:MAG: taurine-pyruvate aminotransferase [Candidatus Promineifilaceae bacterium]|jgi:taurine-pyruvate aminotransferase